MLDQAEPLALTVGVVAALMWDRTAWALLIGHSLAQALIDRGVTFDWTIWGPIDLGILMVIAQPNMKLADMIIAGLFPLAWIGYEMDGWAGYYLVLAVVELQLLLTFPLSKLQKIGGSVTHGPRRPMTYEGS